LHDEWLDVVEAYTPRDLVEPKDRFLAIAGLAVRFYNAKAVNGGTAVTEDYLAGLWKDNLARHLAWSVVSAVDPRHNLQHIAPSWSWASLPLRVRTRTKAPFKPSKHFELVAVEHVDEAHAKSIPDQAAAEAGSTSTDYVNRGRAVEERGRGVKVVEVQGRFRRFIAEDAQEVLWDAIECQRADQRSSFDFRAFPGHNIYARHRADGRIMSRDAHSGEVVGQLDYLVQCGSAKSADQQNTAYLPEGAEKELMCLELGESAMLLLVRSRNCDRPPDSYKRVGVAIGYGNRKGFFYGCDTKRIRLV
jgi:hypothetical protein